MTIVLILNYNDFKNTYNYINAIKNYESIDKIVVVDNMSTDDSFKYLQRCNSNKVDVIQTFCNKGYAHGNNFGIRYIKEHYNARYVVISNPDVKVSNDTIKNIVAFSQQSDAFAVSGLIHNKKDTIVDNFAWKVPNYFQLTMSNLLVISKLDRLFYNKGIYYNKKNLQTQPIIDVEVLSGCFFCVDLQKMIEISMFDESTFLYGEENILFYKAKQKGYKCYVLTQEKVVHFEGETISKNIDGFMSKMNIYKDSMNIYIKEYLKKGPFATAIYNILFNFGSLERLIYSKTISYIGRRKK